MTDMKKQKILIVDDSEWNRDFLSSILEDLYEIIEAVDGLDAITVLESHVHEISLVLLDLVMPRADGFEVLARMNKYHWIDYVPVIMISSDTSNKSVKRAYEYGASDFMHRPFDEAIVRQRVANIIALYTKQRRLSSVVAEQIFQKEKTNSMMVSILSQIVEFRNGESGMHVRHIRTFTDMILRKLIQKTNRYDISFEDISLISMASSLHDIGKIAIPDEILNKPGKLTEEEFEIMKTHAKKGAEMIQNMEQYKDEPLVKVAYEICRWHHERYDGGGYPDGLIGDAIPISAQVVSMADVYDALTSERCYKPAYSHDKAVQMILRGQCGFFNPVLLECLWDVQEELKEETDIQTVDKANQQEIRGMATEIMNNSDMSSSNGILRQLEIERVKSEFYESAVMDITFSYSDKPSIFSISPLGAKSVGLSETILDPIKNMPSDHPMFNIVRRMDYKARHTTIKHPYFHVTEKICIDGEERMCRFNCETVWISLSQLEYAGFVGKIIDIQSECTRFMENKGNALQRSLQKCLLSLQKKPDDGESLSMTLQQIWVLGQYLGVVFDAVRLVDFEETSSFTVDRNGNVVKSPGCCFGIWGKEERCSHCISSEVIHSKGKFSKLEFVDDDIYYVIGMYLEANGAPYSLEMVARIDDRVLINTIEEKKALQCVDNYYLAHYTDPVSGAYNRFYYEEQIYGLTSVDALVMVKLDGLEKIRYFRGETLSNQIIKEVFREMSLYVRGTDTIVRYGDDEFIIVSRMITDHVFECRMKRMQGSIENNVCSKYSDLKVYIKGKYGPASVAQLAYDVKRMIYETEECS